MSQRYLSRKLLWLATAVFFGCGYGHDDTLSSEWRVKTRQLASHPTVSTLWSDPNHYLSSCYPNARKVKLVQSATRTDSLQMLDVGVFSSEIDVALGKPVVQSSTNYDQASSGNDADLTMTSETEDKDLWWIVDLLGEVQVERVSISNRRCVDLTGGTQCLCELSNAMLSVLDEEDTVIASQILGDTCSKLRLDFDYFSPDYCPASMSPKISPSTLSAFQPKASCTSARYVKLIQNTTVEPLQLFEVEVYSSGANVALGKLAEQSSTFLGPFLRTGHSPNSLIMPLTEINRLFQRLIVMNHGGLSILEV